MIAFASRSTLKGLLSSPPPRAHFEKEKEGHGHEAAQLGQKNTHRCRRFEAFCVFEVGSLSTHRSDKCRPACFPIRNSYTHVTEFPQGKGRRRDLNKPPSQ